MTEFYNKFKDDPDAAKEEAFKLGEAMGKAYTSKHNIKGEDIETMSKVLNAILQQTSTVTTIQGNKAIVANKGFCPIMASSMSLNLPWKWLCSNFGWPVVQGIVHSVNPNAKLNIGSWRATGGKVCEHIYEI